MSCRTRRLPIAGGGRGRRRGRAQWSRSSWLMVANRRWRQRRRSERRQESLRVAIPLGIRGQPDAELDVRDGVLGDAARPDRRDGLSLGDEGAGRDEGPAEVQEGHGVPVARLDRHRQAVGSHPADESDLARDRGEDRVSEPTLDVDSAVLSRCERVVLREEESTEHRSADRPRPRTRGGGDGQGDGSEGRDEAEKRWVSLPDLQTATTVAGRDRRCQIGLQRVAIELVSRRSGEPRHHFGRLLPGSSGRDELCHRGRGGVLVSTRRNHATED